MTLYFIKRGIEMKKYYGIDWLRAIACIGIMMMHMCANNSYLIDGFIYQRLIPSSTDFVFLFMAISAFGMCCGYFDKVMTGQVNWTVFYKKRYSKVLPFFLLLIIIDLLVNFSIPSLFEGLTEITLLHGFIPKSFSVIGVGWFLGTVFIFYLIFPFYCVLIENRRCAWCAFAVSIMLNYICSASFDLERENFINSLCYFLAGGLVYLYKEDLEKVKWYLYLPVVCLALSSYYMIGGNTLTRLFVTIALLIFAISTDGGKVRIVSFISDISMEFYLSHMAVFRLIEKFHLNTLWGNGWKQFIITTALVFVGTVLFSFVCQKLITMSRAVLKR